VEGIGIDWYWHLQNSMGDSGILSLIYLFKSAYLLSKAMEEHLRYLDVMK